MWQVAIDAIVNIRLRRCPNEMILPPDEAISSRTVFVIVTRSDRRTGGLADGRAETLLESDK